MVPSKACILCFLSVLAVIFHHSSPLFSARKPSSATSFLSCGARTTTRVVPSGMGRGGTGRSNWVADILRWKHFSISGTELSRPVPVLAILLDTTLVGGLAHPSPNGLSQGHTNVRTGVVKQWAHTSPVSQSSLIKSKRCPFAAPWHGCCGYVGELGSPEAQLLSFVQFVEGSLAIGHTATHVV